MSYYMLFSNKGFGQPIDEIVETEEHVISGRFESGVEVGWHVLRGDVRRPITAVESTGGDRFLVYLGKPL